MGPNNASKVHASEEELLASKQIQDPLLPAVVSYVVALATEITSVEAFVLAVLASAWMVSQYAGLDFTAPISARNSSHNGSDSEFR